MKRMMMLLALSVAALTTSVVYAANPVIHVRLEHPTMVGEATLPAGEYVVQVSRTTGDIPLLIFQGKDKAAMVVATQAEPLQNKALTAELVLTKNGDQYRLSKVIVDNQCFEVSQ